MVNLENLKDEINQRKLESSRQELESYIEPEMLKKQGIFKVDVITKLVQDHLDSKKDSTFRVWSYYCFQKWYKFNFLNEN